MAKSPSYLDLALTHQLNNLSSCFVYKLTPFLYSEGLLSTCGFVVALRSITRLFRASSVGTSR